MLEKRLNILYDVGKVLAEPEITCINQRATQFEERQGIRTSIVAAPALETLATGQRFSFVLMHIGGNFLDARDLVRRCKYYFDGPYIGESSVAGAIHHELYEHFDNIHSVFLHPRGHFKPEILVQILKQYTLF